LNESGSPFLKSNIWFHHYSKQCWYRNLHKGWTHMLCVC